MQQLTVKLRLRDKHAAELNRQARAVNRVWNDCNEAQRHAFETRWAWKDKWLTYRHLARATAGAGVELNLHSHTVQRVCKEYVKSRQQQKKRWLRFRDRDSLGWVPFNTGHVSFDGEAFCFHGVRYETMHLRDVLSPGVRIGAGSFNQDARGRWYINLPIELECASETPNKRIGDIHAKIANRRKDYLHKESTKIAKTYGLIVVDDVSPSKLAKTQMAKSVLDAGWAGFRQMLSYKAMTRGGLCLEVCEAHTTQACSQCGCIAGPRGRAGLNERMWQCFGCDTVHHRDTNAAKNILRARLSTLVEGASTGTPGLRSLGLQAEE